MLKIIGEGTHGVVHKVLEDGKYFAVKKLKTRGHSSFHFCLEVSIMSTYKHPYLNGCVKVVGSPTEELLIYMHLAEIDLNHYIKSNHVPLAIAIKWTHCVAVALRFLKHELIVHGDVKPHNILICKNMDAKLADFGSATMLENEYVVANCGTIRYSSPEMLLKSILSHEGDMWSLGCVIYEMLTGVALISSDVKDSGDKRLRTAKSIQVWRRTCGDGEIDESEACGPLRSVPITFHLEGDGAEIVHCLLCYKASERLTVEQLLDHEWLSNCNTQSKVDIHCGRVDEDLLARAINHIESYAARRSVSIPQYIMFKAANIYTRTEMKSELEIEACLAISQRLFRTSIEEYHPTNVQRLVDRTATKILEENDYRIHKHSMSELYVRLGR